MAKPASQPAAEDVEETEDVATGPKEKKHDTGSADLEKVTDFAEEKELKAEDLASVSSPAFCATTCNSPSHQAMTLINEAQKQQKEAEDHK